MKPIIFIFVLLLCVACGKQSDENKCMTKAQVQVLCLAEAMTNKDPSPNMVPFYEIDCERLYPVEDCYTKKTRYYTYEY